MDRYIRTLMDLVQCRNSGFTANKLMLGQEVNTPADLLYAAPKQGDTVDLEAYVVDLE